MGQSRGFWVALEPDGDWSPCVNCPSNHVWTYISGFFCKNRLMQAGRLCGKCLGASRVELPDKQAAPPDLIDGTALERKIVWLKRTNMEAALEKAGTVARASQRLGVSRWTFYREAERIGLVIPRSK